MIEYLGIDHGLAKPLGYVAQYFQLMEGVTEDAISHLLSPGHKIHARRSAVLAEEITSYSAKLRILSKLAKEHADKDSKADYLLACDFLEKANALRNKVFHSKQFAAYKSGDRRDIKTRKGTVETITAEQILGFAFDIRDATAMIMWASERDLNRSAQGGDGSSIEKPPLRSPPSYHSHR